MWQNKDRAAQVKYSSISCKSYIRTDMLLTAHDIAEVGNSCRGFATATMQQRHMLPVGSRAQATAESTPSFAFTCIPVLCSREPAAGCPLQCLR
jgi:hypothetical protein